MIPVIVVRRGSVGSASNAVRSAFRRQVQVISVPCKRHFLRSSALMVRFLLAE